jgi:hypothetical protein
VQGDGNIRDQELLKKLSEAIEEWDSSPYFLPGDDLFDLERFLADHDALETREELESIYGTPLNYNFWSSFLAFHRLKRAREKIRVPNVMHEEKRRQLLRMVEEEKRAGQKWLKEWFHNQRRRQIKVLPGGRGDKPPRDS